MRATLYERFDPLRPDGDARRDEIGPVLVIGDAPSVLRPSAPEG